MSSAPAFNGSLSYVFLEANLRGTDASLGANFPGDIWIETVKQSSARPLFTAKVDVVKSSGVELRLGKDLAVHLPPREEFSFVANTAGFASAAEARTFHDDLTRALEKAKAQHTLREGARLVEQGGVTTVGFQL
jgi:hypothetical protein